MNAKKIMGAVLVALLAAALFVGAGAAVDNLGTVFINQNLGTSAYDSTYSYGAYSINVKDGLVSLVGDKFVEGTYSNGTKSFTVKNPTASYTLSGKIGGIGATYAVGTLFPGDQLNLTVDSLKVFVPSGAVAPAIAKVVVADEKGKELKAITSGLTSEFTVWTPAESNNISSGKYTITAVFDNTTSAFGPTTPYNALIAAAYSFKVAKATAELSVAATEITVGDAIKLNIVGKPGKTYYITGWDKVLNNTTDSVFGSDLVSGTIDNISITLPNDGKAYIVFEAYKKGTATVKITAEGKTTSDSKVEIKVNPGAVTIKTEKDSYFIGEKVTIVGTIKGGEVKGDLYIKGTNYPETPITPYNPDVVNGNWKADFESDNLNPRPDAGTYTLVVVPSNGDSNLTTTVALKQPFINIVKAPAVAVKGNKYEVEGTAEAAGTVKYYIFGTNFFLSLDESVGDENKFTIEIPDVVTKIMDAGQYFLVVQHPMYDKQFNIGPVANTAGESEIWLNENGPYEIAGAGQGKVIFNVDGRQTTNAAQALCDALDSQNIDDMYVKASFIIAAPVSTINAIPAEITKGSKLTISGNTNIGEDKLVTVEMLSTAFAAVPKETVGSAAFVALTTKTDADGNWVVEFDTSSLNVDEYTVSVAVADLDATTAKINVIEGAPVKPTETVVPTETQQPTQPTQTQQPTTPPKTPGFGALAALAGLGAVAVLLLRRE